MVDQIIISDNIGLYNRNLKVIAWCWILLHLVFEIISDPIILIDCFELVFNWLQIIDKVNSTLFGNQNRVRLHLRTSLTSSLPYHELDLHRFFLMVLLHMSKTLFIFKTNSLFRLIIFFFVVFFFVLLLQLVLFVFHFGYFLFYLFLIFLFKFDEFARQ